MKTGLKKAARSYRPLPVDNRFENRATTEKTDQKLENREKLALLGDPGRSPEKDMPERKPKLYIF